MCRYGFHAYKNHFACFRCRKTFKRPLKREVDPSGPDRPAKCPECGLLMASMGLDFAAPRRSAVKQWRLIEALWDVGITFHSCGCGGPGWRPRDARAYASFLQTTLEDYRRNLRAWMDEPPTSERSRRLDRGEAILRWQERVRRVEDALAALP